jgi:putative peptidoglycan lipid II flippase
MAAPSITRAATAMGAATLLSRLIGFVRVLVIAAVLGTTFLGNTFQASNSVSNVLFELLAAGALSAVLVPTFVHFLDAGDQDGAQALAGNLLGLALVVLGVLSLVGVLAAPLVARVLTSSAATTVAADQRSLATFLLRFFLPQVVLYALGAIAIAVLQAQRRFAVPALAPIGNTVMMVVFLLAFRALRHGAPPSLHVTIAQKLCLAAGGTLGVAAFVGVPAVALWIRGFRLRPRLDVHHPELRSVLRLSAWGVLQHAGTGVLLGAALIVGNGVAGGVVAYQVAYVFFLVPYAIAAQPIHTTILPEMAADVTRGDLVALGGASRWGVHAMAFFVLPAAALMVALAQPLMRVLVFGHTGGTGVALIAGGLAGLAAGLPAYGAFLLLSRAYYALGDTRTPALAGLSTAVLGAAAMAVVAPHVDGAGRVAVMGAAHSAAFVLAAGVLAAGLRRRTGIPPLAPVLGALAVAATAGAVAAWLVVRALSPSGRATTAVVTALASAVGAGVYIVLARPWVPARDLVRAAA